MPGLAKGKGRRSNWGVIIKASNAFFRHEWDGLETGRTDHRIFLHLSLSYDDRHFFKKVSLMLHWRLKHAWFG